MKNETSRREFLRMAASAGIAATLASAKGASVFAQASTATTSLSGKSIVMAKLPFAENALEPSISARTVNIHYHRHHKGYYDTLKAYVDTHPDYADQTLEDLIRKNKGGILLDETIFDISVLLYNHNWYWQSLTPKGGGVPKGAMGKHIAAAYGSYDKFREIFIGEALKLGVGWVWMVRDGEAVKVYRSEYQDTPILKGYQPLLAIDVWEHSYYLDYQNDRRKYVEAVLDHLLNWDFAEKQLAHKNKQD